MKALTAEQTQQVLDSFNQLRELENDKAQTTAKVLRLCLKYLALPSPFLSGDDLRKRRGEREQLVVLLKDVITLFEKDSGTN